MNELVGLVEIVRWGNIYQSLSNLKQLPNFVLWKVKGLLSFFGQSGWAGRWRDWYQWGLPRLVSRLKEIRKSGATVHFKCHQNWNVTKPEMSPKLKCHQNWNVTKIETSPKLKCHQNWNDAKTEMSPKLKFHQNWTVTKTEMSPKLKC